MISAQELIDKLNLEPLPEEGGFFRQTYKSQLKILQSADPATVRHAGTAIYFMLTPESFSALHRLSYDEVYHFYSGDPVEMIQIGADGRMDRFVLGSDIVAGQCPQVVAPKGVWQASRLCEGGSWALMGATMTPGFDYADFEMAISAQLLESYPQHMPDILKFTRDHSA